MALELVLGALLGVFFDQIRNEIWRVKDNVAMFKPELEKLEQTLDVLYPVIEEIEELNRRLNRPNHGEETIILRRLLEDGTKLVCKCSKIPRWDFLKQSRYREKLTELDERIMKFTNLMQAKIQVELPAQVTVVAELPAQVTRVAELLPQVMRVAELLPQVTRVAELLPQVTRVAELLPQVMRQMMIMSLNQQGSSALTVGLAASSGADSSALTMGLAASSGADSSDLTVGLAASSSADSSDLTVGLIASSADSSYKLKIVFKVDMQCQKCRVKALQIVAGVEGVSCVGFEGDDLQKVVVIGDRVDTVYLARCLRKKFVETRVLSIAAA